MKLENIIKVKEQNSNAEWKICQMKMTNHLYHQPSEHVLKL